MEGGPFVKKESVLSLERKEQIEAVFNKLKRVLQTKEIGRDIKNLLVDAEVVGVLTGLKAASYIQPKIGNKVLGFKTAEGLSRENLEQFRNILKELGVDSQIKDDKDDPDLARETRKFKKDTGLELLYIWNKPKLMEIVKNSGLFNDEETAMAGNNPGKFFTSYLDARKLGFKKVYRVGVLYGYPEEDVKDAIETKSELPNPEVLKKAKNVKRVQIKGIKGAIVWGSSNFESPQVQKKIKEIQEVFDLQRSQGVF